MCPRSTHVFADLRRSSKIKKKIHHAAEKLFLNASSKCPVISVSSEPKLAMLVVLASTRKRIQNAQSDVIDFQLCRHSCGTSVRVLFKRIACCVRGSEPFFAPPKKPEQQAKLCVNKFPMLCRMPKDGLQEIRLPKTGRVRMEPKCRLERVRKAPVRSVSRRP